MVIPAGLALPVSKAMTRSLPPVPLELIVPIATPPTETTLPTLVPLDRVTVPAVLMPSTSCAATSLAVIETVSVAPFRLVWSVTGSRPVRAAAVVEQHGAAAVRKGRNVAMQDRVEIHRRRSAEDDIGLARIGPRGGIVERGADDEIVKAVAVDVASRGDAEAGPVARIVADNDDAVGRLQIAEVDIGESAGLAEDDIGLTGIASA